MRQSFPAVKYSRQCVERGNKVACYDDDMGVVAHGTDDAPILYQG